MRDMICAYATENHIILIGATGTGKTYAIKKMASANGKKLTVINGHPDLMVEEPRGTLVLKNGSSVFLPGPVTKAVMEGSWLLIDEPKRWQCPPPGHRARATPGLRSATPPSGRAATNRQMRGDAADQDAQAHLVTRGHPRKARARIIARLTIAVLRLESFSCQPPLVPLENESRWVVAAAFMFAGVAPGGHPRTSPG